METIVDDIIKFKFCMSIEPIGEEISKEEFEDLLSSWPRATTYNYTNAIIWRSPWKGKMKWIAMNHLDNRKYYKLV
jgi:hypothetical protein